MNECDIMTQDMTEDELASVVGGGDGDDTGPGSPGDHNGVRRA
jgi:bacteriocin-like protein